MKFSAILLWFCVATAATSQEWTRFRGPNGSGISTAKSIPARWTEKDFIWKTALPGAGHSSPVLWGDQVFVTTSEVKRGQFMVIALKAADGGQLWQKDFPLTPFQKSTLNSFASATLAVDAERIYGCRTDGGRSYLFALDHRGTMVWEHSLGLFRGQHGSGASPIVYEGNVIFANEQDGESFLIALEATTGKVRWKTPRNTGPSSAAYATPCIFQPAEKKPVLIFNSEIHGISGISPEDGQVLWEYPEAFNKRSISSPVIAGDCILGSCGSGGGGNYLIAVRPSAKSVKRTYEIRKSAPYVPTSLCVGEWLYLWSDGGIVSRVRAATGEVQWQERVGGDFFGSPVWVDGRLFCVSRNGEVVVVSDGEKFEILARNPLNETTHSTPAVAGDRMFIHTASHLICVGGRQPL